MVDAAEFTDPVAYSPWLALLAVLLPMLVVGWYAGVTWRALGRKLRLPRRRPRTTAREDHLARLATVEKAVGDGTLSLRVAHQEISEIVRSFVGQVTDLDARTMTLEQLKEAAIDEVGLAPAEKGAGKLVPVVAMVYPPEFAPGAEGSPAERIQPALRDARDIIEGWPG